LNINEIENSESIHLKEKTEVYYQMYREARQKAKLAKSLALSSYMEARKIKNLYMLEDIDDSDESDLDDLEN
jgi:plasmid rolling circle replication initiator protein Rep